VGEVPHTQLRQHSFLTPLHVKGKMALLYDAIGLMNELSKSASCDIILPNKLDRVD